MAHTDEIYDHLLKNLTVLVLLIVCTIAASVLAVLLFAIKAADVGCAVMAGVIASVAGILAAWQLWRCYNIATEWRN